MKKLWMRVGMLLSLDDIECDEILGDEFDAGRMAQIIRSAFTDGRAKLDGNTYVPADAIYDFNNLYGTDYSDAEPECEL